MLAVNPKKPFNQSARRSSDRTPSDEKKRRVAAVFYRIREHGVRLAQIRREFMPMGCATGNCFALVAFNRKLLAAGGGTPVKNIRVEHIRVHEGGQAIVGAITSRWQIDVKINMTRPPPLHPSGRDKRGSAIGRAA